MRWTATAGLLLVLSGVAVGDMETDETASLVFEQDFRGKRTDPALRTIGPARLMRPGKAGLSIDVPAGQPSDVERIGVGYPLPVVGDCEVRTTVELLPFGNPAAGYGTGVVLLIEDAVAYGASFQRIRTTGGQDAYVCHHFVRSPEGEYEHKTAGFPATTAAATLRLSRSGSKVVYAVSEDGGATFRDLHEIEFTDAPLKVVSVYGQLGGAPNELHARLLEFRIVAERVALRSETVAAPPAATTWPWWAGGSAAAAVLIASGWWWRRNR